MSRYVQVRGVKIGEGIPKICAPIVGRTMEGIFEIAKLCAAQKADIVEWRADWYDDIFEFSKVEDVLRGLRAILGNTPILFTFRTAKEGGKKEIEPKAYIALNQMVIESCLADMVDVELFTGETYVTELIDLAHKVGVAIVASNHDFEKTPDKEEIISRLCKMQELDADILKIAVMPQHGEDVVTLMTAANEMVEKHASFPVVAISMGEMGVLSRVHPEAFCSSITFGTVGAASAPGQKTVEELRVILKAVHENAPLKLDKHIFLIGFMGTGKSTIARRLKEKLQVKAWEMDEMIVQKMGMPISEIFGKYGEEYFRDLESELLEELRGYQPAIISCGGGVVIREKNVKCMEKSGHIILLTATPETIYERVKNSTDRPILNQNMSVEHIEKLMEKRRESYLYAADLVVETDGKTTEEICAEILSQIKNNR